MYTIGLLGGWLLLVLAVLLGGAGAVGAFFGAAIITSSVLGLCLAALAACLAISGGLTWLAAKRIVPSQRGRLAIFVGGGTTLLVILIAALTLFRPLATPLASPLPLPSGAGFWDLPTGSRIAYRRVPAIGVPKPTPIIRLHGGPGAYAVANPGFDRFYQRLAEDGYTVYVYDQIGSGLSARLTDTRAYTMRRHIADLEAVRQRIGAERVILLGDSWGATLAANYMAVHPERVIFFDQPEQYVALLRTFLLEPPLAWTPDSANTPPGEFQRRLDHRDLLLGAVEEALELRASGRLQPYSRSRRSGEW